MTNLILQVLGNSDIVCDGLPGSHILKGVDSLEDIKKKATWIKEDIIQGRKTIDFPLIKDLSSKQESDTIFVFILTKQEKWMQQQHDQEGWEKFVASDGIWWQESLAIWCDKNKIKYFSIILDVEANISYGVADWEGMAKAIDSLLKRYLIFDEDKSIYFQSQDSRINLDKIIIQHSSGTPALNGAVYLWGVDKKLVLPDKIEFVYLSEQPDSYTLHNGEYWQWRLKDPQIRELLRIQDFSGALKLLDNKHPNYQQLKTDFEFLDKSISFNLIGTFVQDRDSILERLGIAIWSEKAFRDRSQWMHWYLRVAGALELAILLLVEKQGNGDYQWRGRNLVFKNYGDNGIINTSGIKKIVTSLLTDRRLNKKITLPGSNQQTSINFTAIKVSHQDWNKFKEFYTDNWQLSNDPQYESGFIELRNSLYHALVGDNIDQLLDQKTQELNNDVSHEQHPSEIAIKWLKYILHLSGWSSKVEEIAKTYSDRVLQLINNLES